MSEDDAIFSDEEISFIKEIVRDEILASMVKSRKTKSKLKLKVPKLNFKILENSDDLGEIKQLYTHRKIQHEYNTYFRIFYNSIFFFLMFFVVTDYICDWRFLSDIIDFFS